jgi:DNA-binding transcriptional regulator YhcF (GntR family)
MKKPIAIAAAILAIGVAGTAVAAPGGGVFGGSPEEKQVEFARDLAQKLDGVNANQVEQGLAELQDERRAETLNERAIELASQLDGVSVDRAKAALETVHESVEEGTRPDPSEMDSALAEALGVSEADLEAARQAGAEDRLDQAVKDGEVTEQMADQIREQIESGEMPEGGPGHGPGPGGPGSGFGGPGEGGPEAGI